MGDEQIQLNTVMVVRRVMVVKTVMVVGIIKISFYTYQYGRTDLVQYGDDLSTYQNGQTDLVQYGDGVSIRTRMSEQIMLKTVMVVSTRSRYTYQNGRKDPLKDSDGGVINLHVPDPVEHTHTHTHTHTHVVVSI